jgi:hypothetical protein
LSKLESMLIPETHKRGLIEAHKQGSSILEKRGFAPEPLETALVAEAHRWFWKPKVVNFMVVAESHVYTDEKENKVKMKLEKLPKGFPRDAPLGFVKLVYCLGYGKRDILDPQGLIENKRGTPHYWKLFGSWIDSNTKRMSMEWKLRVLNRMQEKGIWLLDACCHACAFEQGPKLSPKSCYTSTKKLSEEKWFQYHGANM